jgi:hypothetical protein
MEPLPSASIRDHFALLTDPRSDHTKQHQLLDIVTIALCGVICGAESWVKIEQFGNAKLPWLRTFLALPHGIPSHDTFGLVFAAGGRPGWASRSAGWRRRAMPVSVRGCGSGAGGCAPRAVAARPGLPDSAGAPEVGVVPCVDHAAIARRSSGRAA